LQSGGQRSLDAGPDLLAWTRGDDELLAIVNFGTGERPVSLPGHGRLELSTDPGRAGGELSLGELTLAAGEGVLVRMLS
jgi:hypothetical protein